MQLSDNYDGFAAITQLGDATLGAPAALSGDVAAAAGR